MEFDRKVIWANKDLEIIFEAFVSRITSQDSMRLDLAISRCTAAQMLKNDRFQAEKQQELSREVKRAVGNLTEHDKALIRKIISETMGGCNAKTLLP